MSSAKQEILTACLDTLEAARQFSIQWDKRDVLLKNKVRLAGELQLEYNDSTESYAVIVAHGGLTASKRLLIPLKETGINTNLLFFSDFITTKQDKALSAHNINYVDTAGNMLIQGENLFIHIRGNKRSPKSFANKQLTPSALKLIYCLLKKPKAITAPHRELAAAAGVSLGSVPGVLSQLRQRNYVVEPHTGAHHLVNAPDLFEEWCAGYIQRLRPKLFRRSMRTALEGGVPELLQRLHPKAGPATYLVGGEAGASMAMPHTLTPGAATLHVSPVFASKELVAAGRLLPDPQGNVHILELFGEWNAWDENDALADALLLYAEMHMEGDTRIVETARALYEEHIAPGLTP